jgi:hypothetical protein
MVSRLLVVLLAGVVGSTSARGYSVLTHEAVIDAAWKDNLQPLLLKRYPNASEEDLRKAHAYAYGGAIIQDIGYYPFGNKFVSDLTHYVRSADFILTLLADAQDLNEYAFALGSMAHYAGDNHGHREAVNRAVPLLFPKMRTRFGNIVTYADDSASHIKTEFAFDVAQVAQGNYATDAYHNLIGFEVAQAALERAFAKTYALEFSSVIKNESLAIGTYRFAVSSLIPSMTKAAWAMKGKELMKSKPGLTKRKFVYNMSRSEYQKKWNNSYQQPGFGSRVIAFFFRILPKVGPLKAFAFHAPTPEAEKLFMQSVNGTLDQYRQLLAAHAKGTLKLPNENFDTGAPVTPGKYRLADQAYATLLDKLQGKPVPPELRDDILAYFSDLNAPYAVKSDPKAWEKVLKELDSLRTSKALSVDIQR